MNGMLINTGIVARYTEPRPQTETGQIEPTHLVARGLFASGGNRDEHVAEPANGRDGPRVSLYAERHFHFADKHLRRQSIGSRRAKNTADQSRSRFDGCIGSRNGRSARRRGLWFRCIELLRLGLFAAQFELQPPAMRSASRFAPEFERTNLRETGCNTYKEIDVTHFLAIAQQGHQRRMTMNARFVQCSDFAVRIVPCA